MAAVIASDNPYIDALIGFKKLPLLKTEWVRALAR